jgi:hypothetical protein
MMPFGTSRGLGKQIYSFFEAPEGRNISPQANGLGLDFLLAETSVF